MNLLSPRQFLEMGLLIESLRKGNLASLGLVVKYVVDENLVEHLTANDDVDPDTEEERKAVTAAVFVQLFRDGFYTPRSSGWPIFVAAGLVTDRGYGT